MLRDDMEILLKNCVMLVWFPVALLLSSAGCTAVSPSWSSFDWPGKSKHKVPTLVLPIWTDTMLHQPNQPGIRGFGARVYFYEREGGDPIEVDGSITVYVFDGTDYDVDAAKPLRKFVITADQLAKHHSMSDLGHSYSVWVPWDKAGGPSQSFSLITRFDGRNGGTAVSEAANKLLPGVAARNDKTPDPNVSPVQQVDFSLTESAAPVFEATESKPFTLTFPSNFERHLSGRTQNDASGIQEDASETEVIRSQESAGSELTALERAVSQGAVSQGAVSQGAVSQGEEAKAEPATGFRPSRFPARREPKFQPGISPLRKLPHRGEWPSHGPMTPRSEAATPN
jgi:hypothetical protein